MPASADPTPREEAARRQSAWSRYKKLMRWMALVALVVVALALLYLKLTVGSLPIHMAIATAAGVGFTVLLGTGLMGLVYFSNEGGFDEQATLWEDDQHE